MKDFMTENISIGKIEVVEVEKKKSCTICAEEFDEIDVVSAFIKTCGHATYCEACLKRVSDENSRCPTCQEYFDDDDIMKIYD